LVGYSGQSPHRVSEMRNEACRVSVDELGASTTLEEEASDGMTKRKKSLRKLAADEIILEHRQTLPPELFEQMLIVCIDENCDGSCGDWHLLGG